MPLRQAAAQRVLPRARVVRQRQQLRPRVERPRQQHVGAAQLGAPPGEGHGGLDQPAGGAAGNKAVCARVGGINCKRRALPVLARWRAGRDRCGRKHDARRASRSTEARPAPGCARAPVVVEPLAVGHHLLAGGADPLAVHKVLEVDGAGGEGQAAPEWGGSVRTCVWVRWGRARTEWAWPCAAARGLDRDDRTRLSLGQVAGQDLKRAMHGLCMEQAGVGSAFGAGSPGASMVHLRTKSPPGAAWCSATGSQLEKEPHTLTSCPPGGSGGREGGGEGVSRPRKGPRRGGAGRCAPSRGRCVSIHARAAGTHPKHSPRAAGQRKVVMIRPASATAAAAAPAEGVRLLLPLVRLPLAMLLADAPLPGALLLYRAAGASCSSSACAREEARGRSGARRSWRELRRGAAARSLAEGRACPGRARCVAAIPAAPLGVRRVLWKPGRGFAVKLLLGW